MARKSKGFNRDNWEDPRVNPKYESTGGSLWGLVMALNEQAIPHKADVLTRLEYRHLEKLEREKKRK